MESEISKTNDSMILNIQKIFKYLNQFEYEEAFLLSSKIMERKDSGDQLFHEWVKSLAEFYSCNNKKTAIQLLEKIKPNKLENEIHFRIINSLMGFYIEIEDEQNFLKYKEELNSNLHILDNNDLLVIILGNISNGYYVFKNYTKSLEYCEQTIKIMQTNKIFDFKFSKIIMIKIMNLLYLGKVEKAQNLQEDFETFLKITNNLSDKEYLVRAIKKFKEVENNEKDVKKAL